MGRPSSAYAPKAPAQGVLYQVVRDHFETFRAEAARVPDRDGLPRFVEEEFRGFLRCGFLAGGFARFHCARCRLDRLVPFSCKRRAVCPSCGGRRMVERAAHLVDRVFPIAPVRQWVLSLPHRLRYALAWDHALCRAVSEVFVRAVLGDLRRRARHAGARGGRGGAVAVIQRFGAALNLNVHIHALVLDGVYVEEDGGTLRFCGVAPPTDEQMDRLLGTLDRRIHRLLARRGVPGDLDEGSTADSWHEEAPVLAGIAAASVQGRRALGVRAGAPVQRWGASAELRALARWDLGPCHAQWNGFDLHAGVVVPARDRARLERVCRYALRPPVAHERIHLTSEGQVVLDLRHRWADGTTRLVFDPVELLERLAALTPRPRINLVALLQRAGCAVSVAGADRRVRRRTIDGDGRHAICALRHRGTPTTGEPSLGGVDAAQLWVRRPGVSPLRGSARADRAHRAPASDPPHPGSSRAADRGTRRPSRSASPASDWATRAAVRRRYRGPLSPC